MKKKVLIFHPALAPYRIDLFNVLAIKFNTSFYFNLTNVSDQKFDQELLRSKCLFKINYLTKGFEFLDRSFRFGMLKIIKKENPTIVICSEFGPITILTYVYKKLFNKQYKIYTLCDDNVETSTKRKGVRAILRGFISKNIDGVILPSKEVCDWFKRKISSEINTLMVPVIHDDLVFRKALADSLPISKKYVDSKNLEGKKVMLYVGRLVSVKNLFFILRAFKKVEDDNLYMVFVGDGPLKDELRVLATELNIINKVLFEDQKEGAELMAWYNLASIFVLASNYEQFGAVVNESLLAGCFVLCSKNAGASSLINSNNGRVFDPNNEDELLFLINQKLNHSEPIIIDKVQLRESKMPFTFSSIMDTFLRQLEV